LIAIRIDKLDAYRAESGDAGTTQVLKCAAKLLRGFVRRAEDSVARMDDDRFLLLLPGSDTQNSSRMPEVVRRRISLEQNPIGKGTLRVYVGTATMMPVADQPGERPSQQPGEQLLIRATHAMDDAVRLLSEEVIVHREINSLRIERWHQNHDGPLNEQNLLSKIHSWGYHGERQETPAGSFLPDQPIEAENLKALLSGILRMTIGCQEVLLARGDCLFIPPGTTCSMEVLGKQPAINFNAHR